MSAPGWSRHFKNLLSGQAGIYSASCPMNKSHALLISEKDGYVDLYCGHGCKLDEMLRKANVPEDERSLFKSEHYVAEWQQESKFKVTEKVARKYLERSDLPTFATDQLPPVLANYVKHVSELSDCDPILATIGVLSTVSAYAQHRIVLQGYFQKLHPVLWSLTLSRSGQFKSTGLRLGTAVLRDLDAELETKIRLARDHGDAEFATSLQKFKRGMPETFTWQGLIDRLMESRGGLVTSSEFSSFLHYISSKFNEGVKSRLTSIYDVVDPIEERTRGQSTTFIEEPYLGICGVSTIDFLRELITPDDIRSGFLARFLLFCPPASEDYIPQALPALEVKEEPKTWDSYQKLSGLCRTLINGSRREGNAKMMTTQARAVYTEKHNEIYSWVKQQPDNIQPQLFSFAKRWGPSLLKLSMLMQVMIDMRTVEPSVDAVRAASKVLNYAMASTKMLLTEEFGRSPQQQKESKVLSYIAKRGGSCSFRQLMQSHSLQGGTKDYTYVVESLEAAGKLTISGGKSQSTKQLELVDLS